MNDSGNYPVFNWNYFFDKLEEDQCVLVLGPMAFRNKENISYKDQLITHLDIPGNPNIYRYYPKDEFFLFDDLYKRTLVCHQIKSFYKDIEPSDTILKLVQIPFHVLLTVTPDMLLTKAMEVQGYNYQFGYYKKNQDPKKIKQPTKDLPLVYNVFGCVNYEESIILTYNDLYDYFKSIFARKSMPDRLKLLLKKVRNIVFLGVSFEKWYMQLLLRELEIHKKQYEFTRFADSQNSSDAIKTFCFEQFKINFITNDIPGFIEELHRRCQSRGLLRTAGDVTYSELEKVKHHVAHGNFEEALDVLEDYTEATQLEDLCLQLAGRYRKFRKRVQRNVLYEDQKEVQEAKIVSDILKLTHMAEKQIDHV